MRHLSLATRSLAARPTFTVPAVLTLAVGIGATTAVYSVVNGVLLRPLPFVEPDALVQLSEVHPGAAPPVQGQWFSNLTAENWEPTATTIGPIAGYLARPVVIGDETRRRVPVARVEPELFDVLRMEPALGRFLRNEDAAEGAPAVVVVSHALWRDQLGSAMSLAGRTLTIDGRRHEVVGVAPPTLAFPDRDTRLWLPMRVVATRSRDNLPFQVTAAVTRLAPGATTWQASAEGTAAARREPRPFPAEMMFGAGRPVEVRVRTLVEAMTADVRRPLIVLMAAVGCLLTIACTNVAHLSLSRAVDRRHEMAIQVALGAGSGRLLVQLTAEALVIGTVGGALGLALAALFLRSLLALAPVGVPRLEDVTLDRQIAALALGVALVASAVSIIAPAWRSAPGLLAALREGSRSSDGPRTRRARRILLASECAVAIVLLVSAALLVRSFARVVAVDPGYDADHVLTAQVYLPGAQDGKADTTDVVSRLLPRVRALPGVVAAGAGNMAPFGSSRFINAFDVSAPGHPRVTARTHAYAVTPGFADALRLRLRAGRLLQDDDLTSPLRAVVVNEAFASAYLAGLDPVGLSLPDFGRSGDNATVVGVVGTVLPDGVRSSGEPATYAVPRGEDGIRREIHLVVRTAGDPAAIAQALRQLVKDTHAHAVIDNVQPLAALASASVAEQRLAASVLTGLATVALLMAAGGIYGVLSYHVSQRHREIGIRTALGASRGAIVSMVFREGILVALVGIVSGLAMAAWTVRGLESLLFGIEPLDSWSFAAAAAALLSMAAVACILPARHAAGVDPVVALRAE